MDACLLTAGIHKIRPCMDLVSKEQGGGSCIENGRLCKGGGGQLAPLERRHDQGQSASEHQSKACGTACVDGCGLTEHRGQRFAITAPSLQQTPTPYVAYAKEARPWEVKPACISD